MPTAPKRNVIVEKKVSKLRSRINEIHLQLKSELGDYAAFMASNPVREGGYFAKWHFNSPCSVDNKYNASVDNALQDPPSPIGQFIMSQGNGYEDEVQDRLLATWVTSDVAALPVYDTLIAFASTGTVITNDAGVVVAAFFTGDRSVESLADREAAASEAMKLGVRFLWNPRLAFIESEGRAGEPDFLVCDEERNADGNWGYVPGDVKWHKVLSGTAKAKLWPIVTLESLCNGFSREQDTFEFGVGKPQHDDAMQLAHYRLMLDALGHQLAASRPNAGLVLGKEEFVLVHDLTKVMDEYNDYWDFNQLIAKVAMLPEATRPVIDEVRKVKKTQCGECPWRSYCTTSRALTDDVSRLMDVTAACTATHAQFGTFTASDLARLDGRTALLVDAGIDLDEFAHILDGELDRTPLGEMFDDLLRMVKDKEIVLKHETASVTQIARQKGLTAALALHGATVVADLRNLCPVTARYAGTRVQKLAKQIDNARAMKAGKAFRMRGIESVPIDEADIARDFDLEDNGTTQYLFGVKQFGKGTTNAGTKSRVEYLRDFTTWSNEPAAEAGVFAGWWKNTLEMEALGKVRGWTVRTYVYTHHEKSVLTKLAAKYGPNEEQQVAIDIIAELEAEEEAAAEAGEDFTMPAAYTKTRKIARTYRPIVLGLPTVEDMKAFFDPANGRVVDVFDVLIKSLVLPTDNRTLKTIATKVCGFVWRDEDPSGGNSIAWAAEAFDEALPKAERDAARERLFQYNEDDCHGTFAVREWLSANGRAHAPGATLPSIASLDAMYVNMRRNMRNELVTAA